jgi:NAD(P)-dependent dehydrogenase (short-subunit alcohol dehydrogenase family)
MRIADCCALVTGAASGLGFATARALHRRGAKVVMVDINPSRLETVSRGLGLGPLPLVADVRDPAEVQAAVDAACSTFGRLQVAINCAGVPSAAKILSRDTPHDIDVWRRIIDINLTGVFNVMRLAAVAMARNAPDPETGERGVIINTASITAFEGQKGQIAYAASKAGVAGMTLPAARDLASHAIRCIAVAPGLFETELFEQIPEQGIAALKRGLLFPGRMGTPSEFAEFVLHIIENSYLNGANLRIDGGARLT